MSGQPMLRLALVTGNAHKVEEINDIVSSFSLPVRFYQANIEKLEIQSDSLEEISLFAARRAFEILGRPLVVDDSGLFVEALDGFPGPYSSYVFRKIGYNGILKLMKGVENRRACFKTAASLILPPLELVFTGETCGSIVDEPRGTHGFGFDPIFIPDGHNKTYAEMTLKEKNSVSHRYKAFKKMLEFLSELIQA